MTVMPLNTDFSNPKQDWFSSNFIYEQRILCITRTVKHNYNSSISTVRIQLHVSALYVGHLQFEIFNLQISYTRCVGRFGWVGGKDLVPPPTHTNAPHILYN